MYMYLDTGMCHKQDGNSCFITLQIICPFELFPHLSFPGLWSLHCEGQHIRQILATV